MVGREQRLEEIKKLVAEGRMEVKELAERFQVSSVTLYKDIARLEQEGIVNRVHGGIEPSRPVEEQISVRTLTRGLGFQFSEAKKQIARIAAEMVRSDEWIYIGCGDTCAALAQALEQRRVHVVTNSLLAAAVLALNNQAEVLVTGGILAGYDRQFMTGKVLENTLQGIRLNKAFLGASAYEEGKGFSSTWNDDSKNFNLIRSKTDEVIVMIEAAKFGPPSYEIVTDLENVQWVVTDRELPKRYRNLFAQRQVELFY